MISKKGLSAVITTILLIGIAIILIAVVWVAVRQLVDTSLDSSKSCFNVFDKVKINERYVCYNSTGNEVLFNIEIGNLDVEKVIVSFHVGGFGGVSKKYTLTNSVEEIDGLLNYTRGSDIVLPGKNGGLTYIANDSIFSEPPNSIELVPIINGEACGVTSSINNIINCNLFA